MKKVTVIGGGTGTFVVLSGLKKYALDLGVIVTMMDSGGSTGRLRDQLGVLPPGDLRQCLVALSEAPELWRSLFLYRFENGDLKGHNFGNIFLSALEKVSSNYDEVLENAEFVLRTRGDVLPVTYETTNLCVEYENGKKLVGEGVIDEDNFETSRIVKAYVEPQVQGNPRAIKRLQETDYIIVGPGDLYTSIIPVLVTDGVRDIIIKRNPTVIYTMNLMTKMGQTSGYTAKDHLKDIAMYLGKEPEYVVVNSGTIDEATESWYNKHHEHIVTNDLIEANYTGTIIDTDLIDRHQFKKADSDKLTRSILRHDGEKLAQAIASIVL